MNNQNLLIYESQILYEILIELADHLNFKVVNISKKELNNSNLEKYDDYLAGLISVLQSSYRRGIGG